MGDQDDKTIRNPSSDDGPTIFTNVPAQVSKPAPPPLEPPSEEPITLTGAAEEDVASMDTEMAMPQVVISKSPEPPPIPQKKKKKRRKHSLIGRRVGNIEIISQVGRGNMGTVYRAIHRTLKTPYAVKVLHRKYSQDVRAAERFRREALVCSQLRHPNVVFVTDFGFQRDLGIYIIMEYLDGIELSTFIEQGPMDAERVCRMGLQVCDALEAAHRLSITHRDLKPDNITILQDSSQREEFLKVLDFGIASMKSRDQAAITTQGMVLGTPAYMSPEQVQGFKDIVGPPTDIYAMGVMLFEMLTGKLPFYADEPIQLCRMHIFDKAPPLGERRPDLTGTMLQRLVERMLEKPVDRRPKTMGEVHKLLRESIRQLEDAAMPHEVQVSEEMVVASDDSMEEGGVALSEFLRNSAEHSPDTPLTALLSDVPALTTLDEEDFFVLMWTPLYRHLIDTRIDTEAFSQTLDQMVFYFRAVLESAHLPHPVQVQLFRCLEDVLVLADNKRQRHIVAALQPLTRHASFPIAVLPEWATAHGAGTWKPTDHRSTSAEIDLEDLLDARIVDDIPISDDPLPSLFDLSLTTDEMAFLPDPSDPSSADYTLLEKLRQPLSVRTLKKVLEHDILRKPKK